MAFRGGLYSSILNETVSGNKGASATPERTTIADVARAAGVSTMTVSRVINAKGETRPATRARVEAAIQQLGYRPSKVARSLSTQRTFTLGLVVPDITNPFFPEIVRGAEDAAWRAGYSLVLCNTGEGAERERAVLHMLEESRADGVVVCSSRLGEAELLQFVAQHPAAVLVNRSAPQHLAGSVLVDDAHGTMRAVHHLLGGGRETIGFLAGPDASFSAKERSRGYRTALETIGREVDESLIHVCSPDEAGGYAATKALLNTQPVDGLVCYNDLVAIGALQALDDLGLAVPERVAVVGCDDIRMASLTRPSLTTLGVSKYELGAQAVATLLSRVAGEPYGERVVLKPQLIVRQSAP